MKKHYRIVIFLSALVIFGFSAPLAHALSLPNPLCSDTSSGCIETLPGLIDNIIGYVRDVVGALAILMFVVSGIYFVISSGDPGKIATARRIAIYAAWGTAIALAAEGLVEVIKAVLGG